MGMDNRPAQLAFDGAVLGQESRAGIGALYLLLLSDRDGIHKLVGTLATIRPGA